METTIFEGVEDHMSIAKEEIFGPVMSISKFKTIDEVVKRANDNHYGLSGGVCSGDFEKIIEIAHNLKCGAVFANAWMALDAVTPFGGFKNSGLGRENGHLGIENYLETKTVIMKKSPNTLP